MLPTRLATRMTLGGLLLLCVTTAVVFSVLLLRGQPRVIEASHTLIEQAGSNLVSQLNQQLVRIEGEAVSMARLAEVLPHDATLWQQSFPQIINSSGNKPLPAAACGRNPMLLALECSVAASSGRGGMMARWLIPMTTTCLRATAINRKAGTARCAMDHAIVAAGRRFIRIRSPA